MPRANAAKNIGLLFISIASIFLLGEVTISFFDVLKPKQEGESGFRETRDFRGLEPDPVLNRVHIPGLEFIYVAQNKREFRNLVRYNTKGLHDYEYGYEKDKDTSRILIFGDSFVEALQVKLEDNFCKIIEKKLNQASLPKKYEVINMGVSGYSPILEYLFFKKEGLKYKPDIVILYFFVNDIYEDSVYKDLAVFDKGNLPLSVHWEGIDKIDKLKGWKKLERKFCNAVKDTFNKSKFYVFLKERFYRLLTIMKIKKIEPAENPFFILKSKPKPEEPLLWNDTFRYITATKKLTDQENAEFLLVTIPIEPQISGDINNEAFRVYFDEAPYSERSDMMVKQFCEHNDIVCINLLDEFRQIPSRDLYFKNDGHFSITGHREVARIIEKKLERLGWLQ